MDSKSPKARLKRARALIESGRGEEALEVLEQCDSQVSEDHELLLQRSVLFGRLGRYDRANRDLTEAIEFGFIVPGLYFMRGLNWLAMKDTYRAIDDFTMGLQDGDPYYNSVLRMARADALMRVGRYEDALDDLHLVGDEEGGNMWTDRLVCKKSLLEEISRSHGMRG